MPENLSHRILISRANIKLIQSLGYKKYRTRHQLFIAEGDKIVEAFLSSDKWKVREVFAKPEWISNKPLQHSDTPINVHEVSYSELKKVSFLKTPHNVLALIELPGADPSPRPEKGIWSLVLDNIQDPGNLGSILRTAAWFGIRTVVCSQESVDVYNPKVVQASMGALTQIAIFYTPLKPFLTLAKDASIPVYGTVLDGENIFTAGIAEKGIILLGNESKGIDDTLRNMISYPLTIPGNSESKETINSLNLSVAAGIFTAMLTRKRD